MPPNSFNQNYYTIMNLENEENDQFLFTLMHQGQEEAFDFIFRKYYKVLTIQAIRYVHDQDNAQSLVQDCFIRFWEKRQEILNIESLYSYLFFMVRNRCIDHIREMKRSRQVSFANQTEFLEYDTEETIDANDLSFHLWKEIAKLPDRSRTAFEFSRIDGLTYAQIALKMGITQKAVEALVSRALRSLRENLVDLLGILVFLIIH